jgi:hypothetical protein
MYSQSDTPQIRPTGLVKVLGPDDIIREGDLARNTTYTSPSDYVDHGATRDMDWRRVGTGTGEAMGGWIGRTLRDFHAFCGGSVARPRYPTEIIRPVQTKAEYQTN